MRYQGKVTKYYWAGMSILTTQQFQGDAWYLCCRWCAAADTGAVPAASILLLVLVLELVLILVLVLLLVLMLVLVLLLALVLPLLLVTMVPMVLLMVL